DFVRGQGLACGRLARRGIPADVEQVRTWIDGLPLGEQDDFWLGFGSGLAQEGGDARARRAVSEFLERAQRTALCAGYGAELRHVLGAEGAAARAAELRAS